MYCFRYELLYNCGIQLLFAGHPSIAFDHLISALPAFPNNPRLWLRIAECCIQQKTTREESGTTDDLFTFQNFLIF